MMSKCGANISTEKAIFHFLVCIALLLFCNRSYKKPILGGDDKLTAENKWKRKTLRCSLVSQGQS